MKSQWYQKTTEQTLSEFNTQSEGLSHDEALKRFKLHGPNELHQKKSRSLWTILINQFLDFLILVLIAAAIIAYFIGEPTDSIIILIIVFLNAILGFSQEYKAEKTMEALKKLTTPNATVKRHGQIIDIPSYQIVNGDIIMLEAGMMIPADLRLLNTHQLQIDESSLTGESISIVKHTEKIHDEDLALGDQKNMAFKGTIIVAGRGIGIVVNTGMKTELGLIAHLLAKEVDTKTPLQTKIADLAKKLTYIVLGICVALFIVGILQDRPPLLVFMTALSLAVAAIPEALPAVLTITLALGARRMGKKNALIRKLSAVEALGSVSVICTDKTGTLTQNKMQVRSLYIDQKISNSLSLEKENDKKMLQMLAQNHDAFQNDAGELSGDPTETALLEFALSYGLSRIEQDQLLPRIAEIPFSSERRLMTTIHKSHDQYIVWCKGAPEMLFPLCGDVTEIDQNTTKSMADHGERVLAFATKSFSLQQELNLNEIETQLSFVGAVGLIDPPRPEVKDAIQDCHNAGIKIIMITGDHPSTALAIASDLNIVSSKDQKFMMTGNELKKIEDNELQNIIKEKYVFARVNPDQKIRLVKALKDSGEIVAMTGDGVNDSPALKSADVGIAMGKKGSDAAREASAIILLDDNFNSIALAVREGRRIFHNIRKFIRYALTGNSGEILTLILAPIFSLPIPLLPIQILWINLVTDGFPGLSLSVEVEEKNIMNRPPRNPKKNILAGGLGRHVIWVGILTAIVTLAVMAYGYHSGSKNWQTMAFVVLCFIQLGHVLAIRSESESFFSLSPFSNRPLLFTILGTFILQLLTVYHPLFNKYLKTTPLTSFELTVCLVSSLAVFIAVEIEKMFYRKRLARKKNRAK